MLRRPVSSGPISHLTGYPQPSLVTSSDAWYTSLLEAGDDGRKDTGVWRSGSNRRLFGVLLIAAVLTYGTAAPAFADLAHRSPGPGRVHLEGSIRFLGKPSQGGVTPDSAYGCNPFFSPNVCIDIVGSGLHVDIWDEYIYSDASCEAGYAYINGYFAGYTNVACYGPGYYEVTWLQNYTFPNGTQLCNSALNTPGKPCETIHS